MLLTSIPVLCSSLYVGYGISLDAVLMRPPHVLVNFLCLVLVELDIVLFVNTISRSYCFAGES